MHAALLRALAGLLAALPSLGLLTPAPVEARVKVVATLPDLAAIAREVGEDRVEITTLAAPDQDPHYVDPRPSLILPLNKADLLIINGMELEAAWLNPLITSSRNSELQPGAVGLLDCSMFIQRMQVPQMKVDRAMGDIHSAGNPHYTFDPRRGASIALAVGDRLARLDPANASQYEARAKAYAAELNALAKEIRARFETLPQEKRRIVSYHQSLIYLTDLTGVSDVVSVEPRPGIPPSPGHVAKVLQTMKASKIKVVVQETYYPKKASETLVRLTGGKLVVIPGGTQFEKGERYVARIKKSADLLFAALSGI